MTELSVFPERQKCASVDFCAEMTRLKTMRICCVGCG